MHSQQVSSSSSKKKKRNTLNGKGHEVEERNPPGFTSAVMQVFRREITAVPMMN